jgi:hypothetical protein
MSFLRFPLFAVPLGTILLVAGARTWPFSSADPAPASPPLAAITHADPEATCLLDGALAALDPGRIVWLEATLWQRVNVQGIAYEATGRYLTGPGQRVRLELKTRTTTGEGGVQIVSDGVSLWQAHRFVGDKWNRVTRVDMKAILATLAEPGMLPKLRDEFLQDHSFTGILPLLQGLRQQMIWGPRETVRRGEREFIKLTGCWLPELARGFAPPGEPWPAGVPRQCRLYLDPRTLWPHRVEWWGPDPPRAGDVALVQMEFRSPVLNRPLTVERCAAEFTFDTRAVGVVDKTREVADRLKARAQELAAQ